MKSTAKQYRLLGRRAVAIRIPMLVSLLVILLSGVAIARPDRRKASEAAGKARHYFLLGSVNEAEDNMAEAYEYYKKAYESDSTYLPAAYSYGMMRISAPLDSVGDNTERKRSLRIARKYVDSYPGDYFASSNYAYFAGMLDTVGETIRVFEILDSLHPDKTLSLLHLGDAYASVSEYDKALRALDKYERAEGMSPALTLHKVSYHLADGDTVGAMSEIDRLVDSNPGNVDIVAMKGNVYSYINMPDSALFYLLRAERLDSTSGSVKQLLARQYLLAGDTVKYNQKVYESLMSEDIDIDSKVELTAAFLQREVDGKMSPEKGDSLFEVLRSQYPHDPRILSLSGRYNAAKGNMDKAIEDISYALDQDNQNEDLWTYLVLYQLRDDRGKDAMASYKKATELIENVSPALRLLYAGAAQSAKDTDEAFATYDLLIKEVRPELSVTDSLTDITPFNNLNIEELSKLSNYYQMAGDAAYAAEPKRMEDCFRLYHDALFFNPLNTMALNNYAYFIIDEEKPEVGSERFASAKKMSESAMEMDGDNPTYLDTYAWILFQERNYEEAKKYQSAAIEQAEKADEVSDDLYSHMGDILYMIGDHEQGVEYWEKALKINPNDQLLKKKVKHRSYYKE